MLPEKFIQVTSEKNKMNDYGVIPPPTKAQEGLCILFDHFLGEDYYSILPVCQEQINTEFIYEILKMYPMKRDKKERLREKLIKFITLILK